MELILASVCLGLASFVKTMCTQLHKGFVKLLREALRTYTRNVHIVFCAVYCIIASLNYTYTYQVWNEAPRLLSWR